MRQHRGRNLQLADLVARVAVIGEVLVDLRALVVVDRVERVGAEQLLELGMRQLSFHAPPIPASARPSRMRRSPERIRLFTVPSGWSRSAAT